MRKFLTFALIGVSAASFAQSAYFTNTLTANSPTFVRPNGSATTAYAYFAQEFSVTATGTYTMETASPVVTGQNSLDTYLALYVDPFVAATGNTSQIAFNDDFTGTFTVLPGPYTANGVTANSTGFGSPQPGSRIQFALTQGVNYWLVNTSFSANTVTGSIGGLGTFYTGIGGGPGNVNLAPVPEPASMAVLGLGALALIRRRRAARK